ncbi:hypothetical protein KC851_00655 [Candidatus Kaiserbacteria bacterium]|nr:hypothetical protein [Candidatus Kaiserbacteria bacterium]
MKTDHRDEVVMRLKKKLHQVVHGAFGDNFDKFDRALQQMVAERCNFVPLKEAKVMAEFETWADELLEKLNK